MIWIAWFAKQELTQLLPFYFRKLVFAFVFSRLDIWIVIYQPSMTLFKLKFLKPMSSARLRTWRTGPHRRGAMRSTKLIQAELNQKASNTYSQDYFFHFSVSEVLLVWDAQNEGVYGVQFADGITEKLPMARGHKMSQVFRSIVYLVKGFQGCWSRLIVKLSHRLCWIHDYSWSFFRHIEKLQWILMNFDCWNILDS